ncbi:MAG: adenosylmethionine decarboxylase [Pseudonocardia sp.]|nr:adenosylmethionine decarboxylase [Pseudonocardia sp.]
MTGRPFAGRHVLAELIGVNPQWLSDEPTMQAALIAALSESGATVLQTVVHRIEQRGLTVLAVLAESHASVHTWPQHGSAFVDVFTCGDAVDPELAAELLARRLGAVELRRESVTRPTAGPARKVSEPLSPGIHRIWDVDEVLWSARTAHQDVLIGRTVHGVTLFCDRERYSSEARQLAYHEALMVPALLLAWRVQDVLVIGSPEGVISQLAIAAGARRVDHVNIDVECVRACARLLPYGYTDHELVDAEQAAGRGEGPVAVHYADGWQYLTDTDRRYDVVVIDRPGKRQDGQRAQCLNKAAGLNKAAAVLTPGGVVVGQAGCPTLWPDDTLLSSVRCYQEVFPSVVYYDSGEHERAFLTGCSTIVANPVRQMTKRLGSLPYRPVSIDADTLRRGAVLPMGVRRALESSPGAKRIVR